MCMKDGESGKVLWQQNADFSKINVEHEARIPKKILKVNASWLLRTLKSSLVQKYLPRAELQFSRRNNIIQPYSANFFQVSSLNLYVYLENLSIGVNSWKSGHFTLASSCHRPQTHGKI